MRDLHAIPVAAAAAADIGASRTNRTWAWWVDCYEQARATLFPLLWRHQRAHIDELFAPVLTDALDLTYRPALVSGDLTPYHLLYDARDRRLAGVIDFGTAGLGDPAADVASLLYAYGESLVRVMAATYPGLRAHLDRARFWAGTLEVQWALAGVVRGERRLAVAHLGGARDLLPVGAAWPNAGESPGPPDE